MAKQTVTTEPVNPLVADTWPDLKRKRWPVEALGPQPDAAAINIGLATCGGRATLMALANAMRARAHGATNGEVKLATTIAGAQPNEHRNQLAAKLIAGSVKLISGEMKTAVKVYKGKGNETRNGQTVLVIALPAKAAKAAAKAAEAAKADAGNADAEADAKAAAKAAKAAKAKAAKAKAARAAKAAAKAAEAAKADAGTAGTAEAGNADAEAAKAAEAGK